MCLSLLPLHFLSCHFVCFVVKCIFIKLYTADAMTYHTEESWEDESSQWDDDDDYGDDEEDPTILCPYCRAEIWEEAPQCPECGEYLSLEDRQARHEWQPRWIVLTALMLLLLIALGIVAWW